MALENLFAQEPALPSMQKMKLPEDVRTWGEAITTLLKQKFPDLANMAIEIEFRKKDEPTGSAVGAASVMSEDMQKQVCVPLVIKRFELSPLDVWMEKDSQAVHPLTPDTFKEQFFSPQAMQELESRPMDASGQYFNDPSMWTSTYPPLQGRYSYASAGFRLLDLIADTMTKEDIQNFRAELAKHAYALTKFEKHGHKEILQKLAQKKSEKSYVNTNDFRASARKLIPMSVAEVKKNGGDRYAVIAHAAGLFDTSDVLNLDRQACMEFLSKITAHAADALHEVDQNGEKMLVVRKPKDGVFLYDDMEYKPEAANDFAAYHVKTKSGNTLEGVVLPLVVDFAGKKQGVKLFISPEHSSMQTSIAGVKNENSTCFDACLKTKAVRVGQTGTFVFIDDGKALATIPVTIKAIDHSAEYPIIAYTLEGKKIRIKQAWGDNAPCAPANPKQRDKAKNFLDAHGMIEMQPDYYIIPSRMVWIPMERFQDVSSTPAEWMSKEAAVKLAGRRGAVIRKLDSDYFEMNAGGIKTAGSKWDISVQLMKMGAPEELLEPTFKKLSKSRTVQVMGLDQLGSIEEFYKKADATCGHLTSICGKLKGSLVKVAAEVEDSETVDTLLSLNFLNPDNLSKFVAFRPVFEKVADYLAQITLASRLGLHDIEESAACGAMQKLVDVNEGLRRVETAVGGNPQMRPLPAQAQQ